MVDNANALPVRKIISRSGLEKENKRINRKLGRIRQAYQELKAAVEECIEMAHESDEAIEWRLQTTLKRTEDLRRGKHRPKRKVYNGNQSPGGV